MHEAGGWRKRSVDDDVVAGVARVVLQDPREGIRAAVPPPAMWPVVVHWACQILGKEVLGVLYGVFYEQAVQLRKGDLQQLLSVLR
jgi:hypothetical protein